MPTQMSASQARLIDPVLSNVAQGYKNNEFVGGFLFPYVPVGQRGGKIVTFGKEDFELYATGRAPGANTKRVQFGFGGATYSLESHSLEGQVPFELMQEAEAVPGIDLARVALMKTQNIIGLRLEVAQANLATTAANYDAAHKLTSLSGTTLWSDLAASDPIANIEAGKDAIRQTIGKRPNTMVMGAQVAKSLRQHGKIIDRTKYTGRDVPTLELLQALFGIERVVIGEAIYTDSAGNFVDVWGKNVVLAYTDVSPVQDMGSPSFGYTYRLNGYPVVEQPYQDRSAKSWIYPVTDEVQANITAATAGYLISPAVA